MRLAITAVAAALAVAVPVAAADEKRERGERGAHRAQGHVSLHLSQHAVLRGKRVLLHGRVRPAARQRVKVVLRGPDGGVARTRSDRRGSFRLRWRLDAPGNYRVRAHGVHNRRVSGAASPARKLTAFRLAGASYYGPGLYGNGVACGGTLTPGTLGVAHRTLPCGTRVKLRYGRRAVTVRVIDRGPYVAGRDYDLTEATKARLGFPGVGTVLANR